MTRPVSQILLEDYSVTIRPGQKGACPKCQQTTFSIKADDAIGKCFHPACGFAVIAETGQAGTRRDLAEILSALASDCHAELLSLAGGQRTAYAYLTEERGIHPQVIQHALLGAVPSGYD